MANWKDLYRSKKASAQEAIQSVSSGQVIFLGNACAEPQPLVEALVANCQRLEAVKIVNAFIPAEAPYLRSDLGKHFEVVTLQMSGPMVEAVRTGRADYIPCNVSQMARMLKDGPLTPDVALVQVSPPDSNGYCSFGISVDFTKLAAESARIVVAEVNDQMPRTLGDSSVHVSKLSWIVESSRPLLALPEPPPADQISTTIGDFVAGLVADGSTIQIGIGTIPNAVLAALSAKRDLGIHSGMISDAFMPLIQSGAVTNATKPVNVGKSVTAMLLGSAALYRFAHENPDVEMYPVTHTHDINIIGQIPNFVAINSAFQIDLTGQVNAETIGGMQVSGVGGQLDFVRGAARSPGGKSIIALTSTAGKGKISRIVRRLDEAAVVSTPRADVRYVVTEYGVADLFGKGLRERARSLAAIAHPDFRAALLN